MAIVVKSGGNAAPALVGAYGGGQGKRWSEDARQQAALIAARDAQNKTLDAQQRENKLSRAFTLERDEAGQERSLETMRLAADLREGTADADQMRRREDVEWAYSTKQRQEFDDLARSYDEAVNSGEFTPDELKEIKRQVIAKQAGIAPLPKLKKESPYPEGQDVGQVWQAPDSPGVTLTRDKEGNVKKLYESGGGAPSVDDVAKLAKTVMETLTTEDPKTGLRVSPSSEEVEAGVKRLLEMHKRLTGGATAVEGATAGSKWEVESGTPKKKVVTGAAKWKD
jgi:hypothetical protein